MSQTASHVLIHYDRKKRIYTETPYDGPDPLGAALAACTDEINVTAYTWARWYGKGKRTTK